MTPLLPTLKAGLFGGAVPRTGLPSLALLALTGLFCALSVPWEAASAALQARAMEPRALAPGADAALLSSAVAEALFGLDPAAALRAVSLSGLPLALILIPMLTAPRPLLAAVASLFVLSNPLVLQACAGGYGLAVPAFFLLFSQMLVLPQRPPHLGMAPLGGGLLAAGAGVPGFSGFVLPVFAVLFLIAPPAMAARHMIAVYLIAFLPLAAWTGALHYGAWLSGADGAGPLSGPGLSGAGFVAAACLGTLFCLACAPGLLFGKGRKAGVPILLACGLAASAPGAPLPLAALAASLAQGTALFRFGGPVFAAAGLLGAMAVMRLTS